ncbi:MAG: hypothetical protein H0U49_04235 [Parachlamydiaceae bacterium]|nr:hypothetical protein [Parachlamydiaceae bacterium]
MSPSVLFSFLESCYSKDTAGKNISKLCQDEYFADREDINKALDRVAKGEQKVKIESSVANLYITPMKAPDREGLSKEEIHRKVINSNRLKKVESQLLEMQKGVIESDLRLKLNTAVGLIDKMSKAKTGSDFAKIQKEYDNAKSTFDKAMKDKEGKSKDQVVDSLNNFTTFLSNVDENPTAWTAGDIGKFQEAMNEIRTSFTTDEEWKLMKLGR